MRTAEATDEFHNERGNNSSSEGFKTQYIRKPSLVYSFEISYFGIEWTCFGCVKYLCLTQYGESYMRIKVSLL